MQQLKSELTIDKSKAIWETLRQESKFFKHFSPEEIQELGNTLKTLTMFRNETISKSGEKLAWIGIILLGQVGLYQNTIKISALGIGDMVGYLSILPDMNFHGFDIIVLQPGYISLILIKDLQELYKTHPILSYKFYYTLCLKSLDILSIQYFNCHFKNSIGITWSEYPGKRIQDYINKCPEIADLSSEFFEKNEGRLLQGIFRLLHLEIAKDLVYRGQYENCIFVIVTGELLETGYYHRYIKEKEIIGFEQFFFGKPWPCDIKTSTNCDILILHRDNFNQTAQRNPATTIKIYKFLAKLYLNQLTSRAQRKIPSSYIEFDLKTIRIPNDKSFILNKSQDINPIDYIYITDSLAIKNTENPGIFLASKLQRQQPDANAAQKQGKNKKPPAKTANKNEEIYKLALEKTATGYVNFNEEIDDLIEYKNEISFTKEKLLAKLEQLKEKNEELKEFLKKQKETHNILQVK